MHAHFKRITHQIIDAIEAGCDQYKMPWHRRGGSLANPVNATTGKAYRGINILGLWLAASSAEFNGGRLATYRQWCATGAQVRRGEKGTPICFWQSRDLSSMTDGGEGDRRSNMFAARTFVVFNEDQVEGAVGPQTSLVSDGGEAIATAIRQMEATGALVQHGGDRAYYEPVNDLVRMPPVDQFIDEAAYASVRAHETVRWTCAKPRLSRNLNGRFGGEAYAMEELVAELGAAFLCARLDVSSEPRKDHAPYIASWLKVLRNDPAAILTAAGQAQAAVDFILNASEAVER